MQGIYLIINTVNGKRYIGQAADILRRWNQHRRGQHNRYLQNAWQKYGEMAFRLSCLEAVEDPADLDHREQVWMNFFRSYDPRYGYNISPTAGSCRGIKRSDKTRRKMSEIRKRLGLIKGNKNPNYGDKAWTEEMRKRQAELYKTLMKGEGNPFYGKKHTEETRQTLSEANRGRKHTEEAKQNMSRAGRGRKFTEEHRQNLSKALKGKNTWTKGRKHTEETLRKMSEARKNYWQENRGSVNRKRDSGGRFMAEQAN